MVNDKTIEVYVEDVEREMTAILRWWMTFVTDERGGFLGAVNNHNEPDGAAPKGLVLNSRILWTFSSAYLLTREGGYLATATRAFEYLVDCFLDREYGGFYWSVDANGKMLDGKKQIYGQVFAIYGFSEYYKATGSAEALSLAKETFNLIEKYSYDDLHLGYIDAFTQAWTADEDLRLSDKDLAARKSMNTHLHVVEAYANLYSVWKGDALEKAIKELLWVFRKHIIDEETYQLKLFFTEDWKSMSNTVSFGHDIEAAWLLLEAAESINDAGEIGIYKDLAVNMSLSVIKGMDLDGGLFYEWEADSGHWNKEKHWWPQAEAMVGFFNAWELSGEVRYLNFSLESWSFIKRHIMDHKNGEWHWGVHADYTLMAEDKAGFWKCPYHNARACMEVMKRGRLQQGL